MLGRLAAARDRQNRAVSEASHELPAPIGHPVAAASVSAADIGNDPDETPGAEDD